MTKSKLSFTLYRHNVKVNLHFTKMMILALLLSGCAAKDPVHTIVDMHTDRVDEVLTYAKKHLDQTPDIMFLEGELDACKIALEDVKSAYDAKKDAMKSEMSRLRVIIAASLLVIGFLLFVLLK